MSNEPGADAEGTPPRADGEVGDGPRPDALARLLIESVHDYAIYALDVEGRVVDWPESARRVKGYTAEEVLGRDYEIFYTAEARAAGEPREALRVAAAEGRLETEGWRVRKGGVAFWANVVVTPLFDADGRLIGFGKVTRDLTEEKRAEEKRAEEDARRLIREQAARAAAEAAEQRARLAAEVSQALASSLDYEETLRRVARLAVPRLADWCEIDLVGQDGVISRVAVAHFDPVEGERAVSTAESPAADAGAMAVIRTGESKLVETVTDDLLAWIARDEEHLELLRARGIESYMAVPLNARGRRLGAITFMMAGSGRRCDETDLMIAEDVGRRMAMAIDNALLFREVERARVRFEEQAIELEEQADELRAQAAELEEMQVELELTNDELQRANEDLRLKTGEAEAARAEAERANAAKSHFLATMSHELRTPLNAIAGYTELLELEVHGPITPDQRHDLSRIRRNQVHLLGLINDVLNFARIEAGQVHYRIEPVALEMVLVETESLIGPQLRQRELVHRRRPGDPEVRVLADPERVQQIILNLLSNAIKFTQPGGRIELDWKASEDVVSVRVRDTGIGIPPDRLETIFEPFIQINRDRISDADGVGLGLAISRDLARAMGGDLIVTSEVGVGSTFTLTLPRAEAEVNA